MSRALSISDLYAKKYDLLPLEGLWSDFIGTPASTGVWFVWGGTTSGKTSFIMQLMKELSRYDRIIYESLEEGTDHTMQNAMKRAKMDDVKRRIHIATEPLDEMSARLRKPKSPGVIVIDSWKYTWANFKRYKAFKEAHSDKLIIIIGHADGKEPASRVTKEIRYDASLKIYVEGYRAHTQGRYIGRTGIYDIWPEKAKIYWDSN